MDSNNLLDTLETIEKTQYAIEKDKELSRYNHLVKAVFSTESGQDLMKMWIEANDLIPVARSGMGLFEIGHEQGKRDFVRELRLILKRD